VNGPCIQCGSRAEDGHHPTGRRPDASYIDAWFKVNLCHDDHELAHDDLRTAGLETARYGGSFVEDFELGLRRLGVLLGRIPAIGAMAEFLALLAGWCSSKADALRRAIDALDQGAPGWRSVPGMP